MIFECNGPIALSKRVRISADTRIDELDLEGPICGCPRFPTGAPHREPSTSRDKSNAGVRATNVNGTPEFRPMMVVHKIAAKGTAAPSRTDAPGTSRPAIPMTKVPFLRSLPNENPEGQVATIVL
jgi:hypothetical protein